MGQPLRCGSTTSDALGRSKAVGYRYVRPSTAKNTDGLTNILTVRIEHRGYLEHHVSSQSPSTRGFAREEVDHPVDNELRRCLPRVDSTMLVAFDNRVLAGSWTCWWTRLQRQQHSRCPLKGSKYIASFAVILEICRRQMPSGFSRFHNRSTPSAPRSSVWENVATRLDMVF